MSKLNITIKNGSFVVSSAMVLFSNKNSIGIEFNCRSKYPDKDMILETNDHPKSNTFSFAMYAGKESIKTNVSVPLDMPTNIEITGLPFKGLKSAIYDAGRYTLHLVIWKTPTRRGKGFWAEDGK